MVGMKTNLQNSLCQWDEWNNDNGSPNIVAISFFINTSQNQFTASHHEHRLSWFHHLWGRYISAENGWVERWRGEVEQAGRQAGWLRAGITGWPPLPPELMEWTLWLSCFRLSHSQQSSHRPCASLWLRLPSPPLQWCESWWQPGCEHELPERLCRGHAWNKT